MVKNPKNIGASVRARLLNVAKRANRDYNAMLIQFAQERFLHRLSVSHYKKNFILKGALLLLPYHLPTARPTKDIDFLGRSIDNMLDSLKKQFQEIASIQEDDGVAFAPTTVTCERINELGEYKGARLHVRGEVGGARFTLQLDVGFGDTIVPGPVEMDYPTILDYPAPRLKVYSLESAVAEKFEAMAKLGASSYERP